MQNSMIKPAYLLLAVAIVCISCNQKKATDQIDSLVVSQRLDKNGVTKVVATCPKGTQMVGGGYAIIVGDNITIRASYPVTRDSWEVDVESHEKENAEQGTMQVYVYFYKGIKPLGMQIKSEEATLNGPGPGVLNEYQLTASSKPYATSVVTSGGFMIEPGFSKDDVYSLGSFPGIANKPGTEDNVEGWINAFAVTQGKTVKVINYILCSNGTPMVGGNTPVFDQGTALVQHNPVATSNNTFQLEGSKEGYFCTGGGYNLSGPKPLYPIGVLQSNAITKKGLFYGWQYSVNHTSTYEQHIYALQIKMH